MPLTELIDHFLAWCREHRASTTAEFYGHGLRRLREAAEHLHVAPHQGGFIFA